MSSSGKKRPPLVAERRNASATRKKKKSAAGKAAGRIFARRRKSRRKSGGGSRKAGRAARLALAPVRWLLRLVWRTAWRLAAVTALIVAIAAGYYYTTLPPLEKLVDGRARGSVTLLDRDGSTFAWRGEQFGGMITARSVSPHLKNAIIATEDKRFYRHFGISPRGIASAIRINLREGRGPLSGNGGSTISQQTAKLLCMGRPYDPKKWKTEAEYERDCRQGSLWRKVKEAVYALALEARYTKDEILTIYLNRAFLGGGARGFEAASQRYFGKSAKEVNPAEAAMLAGLLKAPTRYAPTNNLQRSQDRARVIIRLMEEQGYLTPAEAAEARANPARLSKAAAARAGGYFADWIMSSAPAFLTRETTEDVIIRTTFDPKIQRAAEEALQYVFETKVKPGSRAQAAIIVMSADGAVRAMVGGRETRVSGAFNRATQALRQPGSTFKPFVYATALEMGYSYNDRVLDAPLTINIPGSGPWSPKNYGGKYYGEVTLTEALMRSLNTATVRVAMAMGLENVRKVAADFGLESDLAKGPALALGVSESTLIEMTSAYAGILNGGRSVEPYGITGLRLRGDSDDLFAQEGGMGERVISERAARQLTYMMNQVIERGTGRRARLRGWQAAGKTGTTQAARDAWFIGFTADYVTGVWMGYDDNTPLRGVTGGGLPADIWRETMQRIEAGREPRPLPMTAPRPPAPAAPPEAQPRRRRGGDDTAERVLLEVLGQILGGKQR